MRKLYLHCKIFNYILITSLLALMGCSNENTPLTDTQQDEIQTPKEPMQTEEEAENPTANDIQEKPPEPIITEIDWSDYFDGINGSAVIYDSAGNCCQIYNQELALTRRSPCSTFKIISSLIALEHGIIVPDNSTHTWSGEIFWNEDWNQNIDFSQAFRASCVWYFREVVDAIGKDTMQEELDRLSYGNCDISDWQGQVNTNNNNPALTGFWIESSLLISPREQVEVLERIFGEHSDYSKETQNQLKQVMLLSDPGEANIPIYGKTGMGMAHGIVVDAWFTGFADAADKRIYFCVYLGETDNQNVSSAKAREIAVEIVSDYAACIPASLSSSTRQFSGGSLAYSQAFRKISGFGLLFFTSVANTM